MLAVYIYIYLTLYTGVYRVSQGTWEASDLILSTLDFYAYKVIFSTLKNLISGFPKWGLPKLIFQF